MEEDGRWITTKYGNRVFIRNKSTNDYMNELIRSKLKHKDEEYYYHNTDNNSINGIKEKGLLPNSNVGDGYGLFFGENAERKSNGIYGDVELRFLKSKVNNINKYIGNYYTKDKIDAKDIEIKDNQTNEWKKLK